MYIEVDRSSGGSMCCGYVPLWESLSTSRPWQCWKALPPEIQHGTLCACVLMICRMWGVLKIGDIYGPTVVSILKSLVWMIWGIPFQTHGIMAHVFSEKKIGPSECDASYSCSPMFKQTHKVYSHIEQMRF